MYHTNIQLKIWFIALLTIFAEKITFILGFSLRQTPSENQHTLRKNYYPSMGQVAWKYAFIAPCSG